jgi:hypothetical protein
MVCMVSFLPMLSYIKQGSDNDSRTCVCMGMEELHENLGEL